MIGTVFGWWVSLFQGDWTISGTVVGVALGLVIAAFVVLLAGCVVVWTLVGVKTLFTRKPAEQAANPLDPADVQAMIARSGFPDQD